MPKFTPENAGQMAIKALQARRRNYLLAKEAQKAPSLLAQPVSAIAAEPGLLDDFSRQRLARVRKQLLRLDSLLAAETDPTKLDKLASALSRLGEQERQLAGRPLPGSLRPNTPTKRTMFDDGPTPPPNKTKAPEPEQDDHAEQE